MKKKFQTTSLDSFSRIYDSPHFCLSWENLDIKHTFFNIGTFNLIIFCETVNDLNLRPVLSKCSCDEMPVTALFTIKEIVRNLFNSTCIVNDTTRQGVIFFPTRIKFQMKIELFRTPIYKLMP